MSMSLSASLEYGFSISSEYELEELEEFFWGEKDKYPLLDIDFAGVGEWEETHGVVYVKRLHDSSDSPVKDISEFVKNLPVLSVEEAGQLDAARTAVRELVADDEDVSVSQFGWLLVASYF